MDVLTFDIPVLAGMSKDKVYKDQIAEGKNVFVAVLITANINFLRGKAL